jgi:hypothetical protein
MMGSVKAFLVLCALAGAALAIATSCGPQRSFCPNPDDPMHGMDNNCIPNNDAAAIGGNGGTGSTCTMTMYICNGQPHCGPCP